MSIAQRGQKWVVSLGSGKERIRESFKSLADAKKFEVEVTMKKLGVSQQETSSNPNEVTLSTLKILTTEAIWSDNKSTIKTVRNAELCIDFLGDIPVSQVDSEKIRNLTKHFMDRGNSGKTVNRKISALSVMLKYAEEQSLVKMIPRLPRRKESASSIRFMSPVEEQKAFAFCELRGLEHLSDLIAFGIDTGFRRTEMLKLRMADCVDNYAVLHAGSTKSDKARSVPFTKRVRELVNKRLARGYTTLFQGLSDSQLTDQWNLLEEHMGTSDESQFRVHMLRHTCASRLAQAGKNATFIMNWMGHSSIAQTQKYMHLAPRQLEEGLEALEAFQKVA